MNGTTTADLAAAWTAAMQRARADLPTAADDDLSDIVAAMLAVTLGGCVMPPIQIRHRYTSAVLFEHQVTDEQQASGMAMRHALEAATQARANLAGANLVGAYLAGANLVDANLVGANLAGAYLAGANLTGAKWRDDITISRAPLQISGLRWTVYLLDQHMQIGCELHTLAEWADFDDARICGMDGRDALRFWRAHKDALLSLARSDGRGVAEAA